ncbi:hypothetical protein GCM10023336_21800 [Streptomyces similanensis]|uniref:Glycosyltransferase 2-like domain-containing protein n=1 Tax=Streptomyces similanensis TaxID=1274988 RepID=A0ABP9K9C0_9ACTN
MSTLSVVVPCHNVEAYVAETVRSLAVNADPAFEFLLIDDCSTDRTGPIIEDMIGTLPNARLIRHETNQGVAQARNTGLDEASGDYVTFLDGDDWYAPGHLRAMVDRISRLGCDFARTDHVLATGRKRQIRYAPARLRDVVMDPRDGIAPAHMATMVDYPFVPFGIYSSRLFENGEGRFETRLRTAEDRLWVWRLHLRARSYAALGLQGAFYRRGVETSLTQISDTRQLDFIPAYDTVLREVTADPEGDRFLPKAIRTYCAMIAFHMNKADQYETAVARQLRSESAAALHRMPQQVLDETLATLDDERSALLRRLRDTGEGRPGRPAPTVVGPPVFRTPRPAAAPAAPTAPRSADSPGRSRTGSSAVRPEPVQIFQASTLYGAATLAAALDAGQFGPAGRARRVLLLTNNAAVPEVTPLMSDMAGYREIAARFDQVEDWNEAIAPHHPAGWQPRPDDAPLWERVLRARWGLGAGAVTLVVESIQVSPARSLAAVFAGAPVHVYADGLMSYGPTRDEPPHSVAVRVRRLLHLDLVPGLRPLLLSEFGVEPEVVPHDAFRAVLSELSLAAADDPEMTRAAEAAPTALLLGQYLAALGILTDEEEEDLHVRMLRAAAAAGHRSVAFKPHPTAPVRYGEALEREAAAAGVRLTTLRGTLLAEVFYARLPLELVVGCFSTAMLTATAYFGIPTARVGTRTVLRRLTPYENSNRVPLVIVDHVVPDLEAADATAPSEAPPALQSLLAAVGYCMQSARYPWLRAEAEPLLARAAHASEAGQEGAYAAYFGAERPAGLDLPGGHRRRPLLRQALARGRREAASGR